MLVERWENFVLEEIVSFGVKEFMRAPATLLGAGHIEEVEGGRRLGGVVQTRAAGTHRAPPDPLASHRPTTCAKVTSNRCR